MSQRTERRALFASALAAIAASACCIGPLVLVSLGLGGAWLAELRVLEPYRLWFAGAAVVALAMAYPRIFRRAQACRPGEVCATPKVNAVYRVLFGFVAAVVAIDIVSPWIAPLFY